MYAFAYKCLGTTCTYKFKDVPTWQYTIGPNSLTYTYFEVQFKYLWKSANANKYLINFLEPIPTLMYQTYYLTRKKYILFEITFVNG